MTAKETRIHNVKPVNEKLKNTSLVEKFSNYSINFVKWFLNYQGEIYL